MERKKLPWTDADAARLRGLLAQPGMTLRRAGALLGLSRTYVQHRAVELDRDARATIATRDREDAGAAPLPAMHPISWGAIALHF